MATKAQTRITAEPGMPQVVITREVDAPRELLFRAYTDPELLVQWMGPRSQIMTIDRFEVRNGGTWRYTSHGDDGIEHGFHGVFHGTPSAKDGIVQTFEYEGAAGHVCLETLTFEDRDGKTLVRTNDVFQSVEDRDAAIASGMESGVHESIERLDDLLAKLIPVS
jgi:uncharacterized protein YndB with AHSA1/START domain